MRQHRWSSLVFLIGVMLVFSALGWVTWHALRLERGELEARAQARYQENIRLALWRMDSTISPILAREAARPYFEYRSFYPADQAYTRMLNQVQPGEVLVPSPLLQPAGPFVKLHFETASSGIVSSPQVPTGPMRSLAESVYVSGYSLALAEQTLSQLSSLLAPPGSKSEAAPTEVGHRSGDDDDEARREQAAATQESQPQLQGVYTHQMQKAQGEALASNVNEYQNRARNFGQAQQMVAPPRQVAVGPPASTAPAGKALEQDQGRSLAAEPETGVPGVISDAPSDARDQRAGGREKDGATSYRFDSAEVETDNDVPPLLVGASDAGVVQKEFVPSWLNSTGGSELIYTRQVSVPHASFTQGFWVDWSALSSNLLTSIHDLLPDATLRPLPAVPAPDNIAVLGRSLASVPAELVAPMPPVEPIDLGVLTPIRSTLLVTWIAALGAVLAIALVLRASLELAERRGRFVSAVTHELRTPLTTFCLYSQMLADGMVPTEQARQSYARTLNTESQRLARIVESVLDYARLGRNRKSGAKTNIDAADLISKVTPPLVARCEQAGMQLVVEAPDVEGSVIQCDPGQIERILYNLVDNACKYAADAEDKRVHLTVGRTRTDVLFTVRDHGAGIDAPEQRRVFRPFMRGQKQSDGSIPGLGLGLSLARGLAKECKGDLRLVSGQGGAEFQLRIPLAATR